MEKNAMTLLLALAATVTFSLAAEGSRVELKPGELNVCEVLANRAQYHGKMVRIRAYVQGNMHGSWLVGQDCGLCFEAKGFHGPCAIALSRPSQALEPTDFLYDERAARQFQGRVRKARRARSDLALIITYVGRFETKPDSELIVNAKLPHHAQLSGFGHGSGFPAQLVVKTQYRVAVVPKKSP